MNGIKAMAIVAVLLFASSSFASTMSYTETVTVDPGLTIVSIGFDEQLEYATTGGAVNADMIYSWSVLEVDQVPVVPVIQQDLSRFVTSGYGAGVTDLGLFLDLEGSGATSVAISFTRVLSAIGAASILSLGDSGLRITTVPVPEASTWIAVIAGLIVVGLCRAWPCGVCR